MMIKDYAIAGVLGTAVGASLTYWLDPNQGRRRRARLSDRLDHLSHEIERGAEKTGRDVGHRSRGMLKEAAARVNRDPAGDRVIRERVRSELGRVASHPGAIEVTVQDGRVFLKGSILQSELHRTLKRISRVRGVRDVDGDIDIYRTAQGVPELQGGSSRRGPRFALLRGNWSPAARLLAGTAGAGLLAYGLLRRNASGYALGALGALVTARSMANAPIREVFGIGQERGMLDVIKTIHVEAPAEEVYTFWRSFENFPRFMSHVKRVTRVNGGRFRWEVEGPTGKTFSWDAFIEREIPNRLLAWQSVADSNIRTAGIVRFDPEPGGGTRLHIQLSYAPVGGRAGHKLAKIFGVDPRSQMDDDLLRFKTLVEQGKATGHETTSRDELST